MHCSTVLTIHGFTTGSQLPWPPQSSLIFSRLFLLVGWEKMTGNHTNSQIFSKLEFFLFLSLAPSLSPQISRLSPERLSLGAHAYAARCRFSLKPLSHNPTYDIMTCASHFFAETHWKASSRVIRLLPLIVLRNIFFHCHFLAILQQSLPSNSLLPPIIPPFRAGDPPTVPGTVGEKRG
jgi:hypothetical protein